MRIRSIFSGGGGAKKQRLCGGHWKRCGANSETYHFYGRFLLYGKFYNAAVKTA